MTRLVLGAVVAAAAGCTDFANPSELEHAQIIGLRVEPPVVAAGERATLELLVAGPDGPIAADPSWSVSDGAHLVQDADVVYLEGDAEGTVAIEVSVAVDDRVLTARKVVRVGGEARANPEMTRLLIDGREAGGAEPVVVPANATLALSFEVEPGPDDAALVSWYTTVGAIDRYRLAAPELVTDAEPGSGWLIVVYRDGRGGTCWRVVPLVIDAG